MLQQRRCHNDNHGRAIIKVRFCSTCGAVLNSNVKQSQCPDERHAKMRRLQSTYCMDCGERLVRER
ncbi:MAG: hypothetical protein DCC71_01145 [Proteobacteria bacterium]|nr:MAG: hypothetical protein DCC71_01145 [Pseudomonadota bacterium]